MNLYTSLVSHALFPLHEAVKRHSSPGLRRHMEQSQWWPAGQLRALQLKRLQALLEHATAHVPYYRALFAGCGMQAGDIKDLSDLRLLPFLDKPRIRANLEAMASTRAKGLARFNTGGSSGEPLIFQLGRERISHDVAAKWRATRWWGVDIGDPEIVVWGSPIELGAQDAMRAVRDRILRTRLLPAFQMTEQKLDGFLAQIRRTRPKMLFGYPSALSHFARHAQLRSLRMDDLGIRVAFVTSERLYEDQRAQIARTFGCEVANGYGGRDAGFIAHQCPHGSMHITAEDIIVEIVDSAGQGVPDGARGEIVVTHLATRDFPFIRYRTGDIGALGVAVCSCGRGLPVLKDIEGRSTDFVIARDGTVMHGLALIYILRDLPDIHAFKIVQESLNHTRVMLVPSRPLGHATREHIVAGFRARLGREVVIDVEVVMEIPPEKSGKFRYVVSKVDPASTQMAGAQCLGA
jgi:phenylacetate-CoA ligase